MASQTKDTSVSQLVAVLIPNAVVAGIFFLLFLLLRKSQKRVYEPRVEVDQLQKEYKPDATPKGPFGWITHILSKPQSFLVQQSGSDGYFFMRFLFEFAVVCFIGCLITWPILFPLNATNSNNLQGLNLLTFANVKNKWRYFGHVFVSWVYFGAVIFLIYRELVHYVTYRHALQTTPLYDSLLSSRVLLLTEVPSTLLQETELRNYFPTATNVWYARDYAELEKKVKERTKLAKKYEGALNKVINKAVKLRNKCLKKNKPVPEPADDLNKYLKDGKKRPTHKLKFLIGKKVDTLDYGLERLGELNKDIKKDQLEHNSNTQIPSVFIEFPTQLELQKAYQAIPYNADLKGSKRFTGLAPSDIIWENLSLTPTKRRIKKIIASTVLTLTIIFWCIPVAVVGAISNINNVIQVAPFLKFINNLPDKLMGIITGLLPVVALAILMSLVPPFIRKMGKVSGCITIQQVEMYCQNWFFAFQVVQSFLVFTLCSAAASSVPSIVKDPSSVMPLLATKLPAASNFYLCYLAYFGLTAAASVLFQMVPLILSKILGRLLDSTPRAKWTRWTKLGSPVFSVIYPNFQLITVIALAYAIIAPLILGFAFITFMFLFAAFTYTLIYVMCPNPTDARGRNYVTSLFQNFVALYLAEVVLVAMFVFTKNWACVALEAVMILFTALCHVYFKWKFLPIIEAVPISAIKHAAGDKTFQYPMHDQGYKEIKTEGENYWQGGNQLGLSGSHHDQVLPAKPILGGDINGHQSEGVFADQDGKESDENAGNTIIGSDESAKHDVGTSNSKLMNNNEKYDASEAEGVTPRAPVAGKSPSILSRFFKPKLASFDFVRSNMPDAYYNYIEYNDEFLKTAYEDPCVVDDEPHIWCARDEMGLSEIEKNKALENGVDVSDENANYDDKGSSQFLGPPPSYEEALRV